MVTHIRSINIDRYKNNYKGFYKKIYILNVYKYEENDHNSRCLCKPYENSFFYSFSFFVKSFEQEIQPSKDYVYTIRG